MKEGDKVLVLLPTKSNKLLMQWKGPYSVIQKIRQMDYKINMGGKIKTFHANLLKKYVERESSNCGVLSACAVSLIDFSDVDADEEQDSILMPSITQTETVEDIKLSADVLTDLPGTTNLAVHKINVT